MNKTIFKSLLREYRLLTIELEKKNKELRKTSVTSNLSISDLTDTVDLGQRIEQITFQLIEYLKENKNPTDIQKGEI